MSGADIVHTIIYQVIREEGENVGEYDMSVVAADGQESIVIQDQDGNDVTANYEIGTEGGTFTINKQALTIKAASDSKTYDGTALTNSNYEITVGKLAAGDSIESVTVTGSQTLVGSSDNVPSAAKIKNAKGEDVTQNYDINYVNGTLTVTDGSGEDEDPVDDNLVVTKTVSDKSYTLGETVTFTVKATNIYEDARTITLSEIEGVTLAQSTFENVAGGATVSTTATYTITEADILNGSFKNTVTANVGNITKKAEATAKTEEPKAHLTVTKKSDVAEDDTVSLGDTITYTITVKNDGNVTITDIELTDTVAGYDPVDITNKLSKTKLAPGETATATFTHVVTEQDILAGSVENAATATGTDPEGDDPTVVPGTTEDPTDSKKAHLTVTKESDVDEGDTVSLGDTITYTITVKNDGNVTIKKIELTDTVAGYDPVDITNKLSKKELAPGATATATFTHVVTEQDIVAGSVKNHATAEGEDPEGDDPTVVPGTTEDPTDPKDAHLTVSKKTTSTKPENGYALGDTITYEITVTNDGNVTITDIELTDTVAGYDPVVITDKLDKTELAPGATATATFEHVVTEQDIVAGTVKNEATATGADPEDEKPEVTPGTTEDDPADPFSKLNITKAADPTNNVAVGDEITYTVVVKNEGNVTVKDGKLVDDHVDLSKETFELAPNASKDFTYTYEVTQEDVDAGKIVNVVTANATPAAGEAPKEVEATATVTTVKADPSIDVTKSSDKEDGKDVAAGDKITYTVVVKNTGNVTLSGVTVEDALMAEADAPAAFELAPNAKKTITYEYTVTDADDEAGLVTNTATATGNPPQNLDPVSDSDTEKTVVGKNDVNPTPDPGDEGEEMDADICFDDIRIDSFNYR